MPSLSSTASTWEMSNTYIRPVHGVSDQLEPMLRTLLEPERYGQWEHWSRLRLLASYILERMPSRVLDLGCGYGALAIALSRVGRMEVVGVDILSDRVSAVVTKLQSARHRDRGTLHIAVADAERGLPFRDRTFDVVVATEVLEHLEKPERSLAEVRRVLRPGGRVYVTTPNVGALPYRLLGILPEGLVRKLSKNLTQATLHPELLGCRPTHPDHHRREGFALVELRGLAAACSLQMVRGHTYRIPLPDRLLNWVPSAWAKRLAVWGSRPIPLGLEVFCELARAEDTT